MREPFCSDCPDHEACMTGYPCEMVKRVDAEANARIDALHGPGAAAALEAAFADGSVFGEDIARDALAHQEVTEGLSWICPVCSWTQPMKDYSIRQSGVYYDPDDLLQARANHTKFWLAAHDAAVRQQALAPILAERDKWHRAALTLEAERNSLRAVLDAEEPTAHDRAESEEG